MKTSKQLHSGRRIGSTVRSVVTMITIAVMTLLASGLAHAGGTVTSCTEMSLRAAMAGGGTVTFACDGTITLSSTISNLLDTVLDGSGHQITISGNSAVRVFYVATNVNFTAVNLTIANGRCTNGAAVLNDGGELVFTKAAFLSNVATNGAPPGTNAAGCGGAICSRSGSVNVSNCVFRGNAAFGSPSDSFYSSGYFGVAGGDGCGAAIYSAGQLSVEGSTFVGNLVQGGGGDVGLGSDSFFAPSYAGAGGSGNGGAIYILGTASVSDSAFVSNVAVGGDGGIGGMGASGMIAGGIGGSGGAGGSANGAAMFNGGTLTMVNCTIASNTAAGAAGGGGGMGGFGEFGGSGGNGGAGGAAFGGICDPGGLATLINCTIASNGSGGGYGGYGGGSGIGPYGNGASGLNGPDGIAAGGLRTVGGNLLNTLLTANIPTNCSGTVTDAGHNLSSDASSAFTGPGSLNNTDPRLGALADNGGPTWTMALLPGSPAIDAGSAAGAPATDQRGVPRPQGVGADIGAYEFLFRPIFTGAMIQTTTNRQMCLGGLTPNPALTLQASTNLLDWWDVTNFMAGTNGAFRCVDPIFSDAPARFYRLKSGTP